ncbi:hypothetical protein B0T24DRAFT_596361 [Lasiosphaeria ovina]|uniref:Uncharacterized protein n=1 Tax=Lasiosphaeria ovina TaxID=92902 RepID=A0AAE0N483_9PEZI|nr:hypothetical protein B0T24DRAFT_596361 [Lasiosphaeria ovina]
MLRNCSCTILLLPVVLLMQVAVLSSGIIFLLAGTGGIDNAEHLPKLSGVYVALIDTAKYETTAGKEKYHGLPDSHDYSKPKDFFAIFPALYCSGKKNGDKYEADYCSPWGKQLFDLQWLWRVWGVDLVEKNYIASYPTLIFAGVMTAVVAAAVALACGALSFCFYWSMVLAALVSWVSAIGMLLAAAAGHMLTNKLVADISSASSGSVSAQWGDTFARVAWVVGGLAVAAAALWALIAVREHRVRVRTGRSRIAARRDRRGGGDGPSAFRVRGASYKHLSVGKDEMAGLHDHGYASHVDLVGVRARTPSPFEPMRHVNVE